MTVMSSVPANGVQKSSAPLLVGGVTVSSTTIFSESTGGPLKDVPSSMRWFLSENWPVGYRPYLVQVAALQGDTVEFFFINSQTGNAFGDKHSVDLTNLRLVYGKSPSTLPDAAQFFNGFRISFLFLNPNELTGTMSTQAGESNPDTGKWPQTAQEEQAQSAALALEATRLRSALNELLTLPSVKDSLTASQWANYQNLG